MSARRGQTPLIAHVIHRLDTGGLENGLVNLINHLDPGRYRHVVIALTEITEYRARVRRSDVQFIALRKPPGHGVKVYPMLYRLFREMRPAIVHTRNLAALEATVPAWAAGAPVRIHGEHGRDMSDADGSSRKYQWIRRLYRPFVDHYVCVSHDLASYLTSKVGVPPTRITQIYNGVDAQRFRPARERVMPDGCPFGSDSWIIGSVGRMDAVKDQLTLAHAFIRALQIDPVQRGCLRLVLVGGGPMRGAVQTVLERAGVADLAWLPGERSDIPAILNGMDCFVLPSRGEGISNTILEAMASGLPVLATAVGGNVELVDAARTGELVLAADPDAMAQAILGYARSPERAREAGRAGRARVEREFSLDSMVAAYRDLYDAQLECVLPQVRRIGAA